MLFAKVFFVTKSDFRLVQLAETSVSWCTTAVNEWQQLCIVTAVQNVQQALS